MFVYRFHVLTFLRSHTTFDSIIKILFNLFSENTDYPWRTFQDSHENNRVTPTEDSDNGYGNILSALLIATEVVH